MSETTLVNKVVLSTGKTVLLREMLIKHQELAAMAAAPKAKDNQALLAIHMQKELVKMLVVQIDGKSVKPIDLENLDSVFSIGEYRQVMKVVGKLMGDDDLGECLIEHVSIGGN